MYYKKHSDTFKIWMIIVEIIFFIAAIIAGVTFKTTDPLFYHERHFNWLLALTVWGSNLPLLAVLYAIYSILDNQETQILISDKILSQLQDVKPSSSSTSTSSAPTGEFWICPKCGDRNDKVTIRCGCGYYKTK